MTAVARRRLPGPLDGYFLTVLGVARHGATCPAPCRPPADMLLYFGEVIFRDKTEADAFVSWLRVLCRRDFDEVISVEST